MTADWKKRWDGLRIGSLRDLFGVDLPVIGMVHLWPLPGAPGYTGYGMDAVIEAALADARALARGGVDGLIVENMWDLPYHVGRAVPPEESACHAVAARAVVEEASVPVGINVVHNGGVVALAIAVASGARFIRVCLLTGAQVWDTGEFDHGCAAELLRKRKELGAEHVKLLCDVDKKHAVRFPGIDLGTHIAWTEFYGADALIVSGRMTGAAPDVEKVRAAKEVAQRPVLVGSGATEENVAALLRWADGVIVGSSLKRDGDPTNPVDEERVVRFVAAVRSVRG
ncbi:MAG: BtpA/SgcQ family protein [Candidatus Bipolaricaulota bacterium]